MEIQLLGTGTPTPSLKRMSSGYLVRVANDVILFDHGPGAYHRMLEAGVAATDVTHVFFSHLHYDHCLDYGRLLITHWDQGAGSVPELKVYGPPFITRMTELLIAEDGVLGPDIEARTAHPLSQVIFEARGGHLPRERPRPVVTELLSGDVAEGDGWRVTARSVRHVQPHLDCYGYRLECADGVFVYSGDSGPCKAMEELARGCDVLVHMCHYLSGTELGKEFAEGCMGHLELAALGRDASVKNLVLSHLTEQMDRPGVRERIVREMSEIYSGNLFLGEDLMKIPVAGPEAGKLD
ncbi:MAG: MBL fold metallo-hydrolase [Gammaproteobacteria bacterium]|nr:MBL fold metallo-hydrolase [Gammaproteobacteria bacterium]NCF82420.1 MBL fold metallo-hydrolase [Pseudomonadota bacterium]